jgi:adenosylmethionine---8-amino-7-oxononanoate aminotransferase
MQGSGMTTNAEWARRDLEVLWHPCTQMKDHAEWPPIPIKSGKGVWLEDFEGNRYIDAISSWWVNLFGHGHPDLNAAIARQLSALEHVILAGFTHAPAIELAEALIERAPKGLSRCFYADNGSSAVEIALKMSYHAWRNQGQPQKSRFITLENSYHGETLGALAVGDVPLYRETYAPLLMETIRVQSPDGFDRPAGVSLEAHAIESFKAMEKTLEQHKHQVAAVIIEPLVQCAGGMRMHHPVYLEKLRDACTRHGVHLIADEIAVGFGRTGTLFALEQAGITPDFLCLSKGLTGGYLPLSAVLTTTPIYDAFYDDYGSRKAFLHSHSYTGNALACAVALESLRRFDREPVLEENREKARWMREAVTGLEDHPHVAEIRQTGMILAIELCQDKASRTPYPSTERRGLQVHREALRHSVLLRPLGNVVYFMPPYVINAKEIQQMADAAIAGIDLATREP